MKAERPHARRREQPSLPLNGKWLLYLYGSTALAAGVGLFVVVPLRLPQHPPGPVIVWGPHWLGLLLVVRGVLYWRQGWALARRKRQLPDERRVQQPPARRKASFGALVVAAALAGGLPLAARAAGEVRLDFGGHGLQLWHTLSTDPTAGADFPEIDRRNTAYVKYPGGRYWLRLY
jgi:hypothetical protein